jgi:hypothetical protein
MLTRSLFAIASAYALKTYSIPPFKTPPVARVSSEMCYLQASHELMLFGGFDESGNYLSDTWSFSLNSNTWKEHSLRSEAWPQGRSGHLAFTDDDVKLFYIFGGETADIFLNDLWAFSLAKLTVTAT